MSSRSVQRGGHAHGRLIDAIESISEGFAFYDPDDRLVVCNGRYREFCPPGMRALMVPGARFEDLVRTAVADGYIRYSADAAEKQIAKRLEQHRNLPSSFEAQLDDGRWLLIHERKTRDGGIAVVQIDITDLRRREIELSASEERFRSLIEGSIQGVLVHRYDRLLFANQALADIFGYRSPEEILALGSADALIALSERERVRAIGEARLRGEPVPRDYELQGLRKDGSVVWLDNRAVPVAWEGGRAILTTLFDVTERKKAERAVRESEERFKDFSEVASDWFWETDAAHRFTYQSRNVARYFGGGWNHILGKTRFALRLVDDADDEKWAAHRADLDAHRPFQDFEYRLEDIDGKIRHVRTAGKPLFDAQGAFVGYRGTGADITEREEAQEALRRSEQRFRNLVEGSIQGVLVDRDDKPVFANQAMADILGHDGPDDLLRMSSVDDFLHPDEIERLRPMRQARLRGEPLPTIVETRAVRKDGSTVWLEVRPTVVDWDGERAIQGAYFDITERKRMEERLRELATKDPLTGIANRRHVFESIDREIERRRRYPAAFALLVLDVDHFKRVNDSYGHACGDRVLGEAARICEANVRNIDVLGRIGGEEFAVMAPDTDEAGAMRLAERLRSAVEGAAVEADDRTAVHLTISVGVTLFRAEDKDVNVVFARADKALYEAKSAGRNSVVFC